MKTAQHRAVFFIFRNMQKAFGPTFEHELNSFMLFLENHDGSSYNTLGRSLTWIYENVDQSKYYDTALFETSQFASSFFAVFWSKYSTRRDLFVTHKNEIISIVAFRLAQSFLDEFKLGNLY